jgi:hypothetical protein
VAKKHKHEEHVNHERWVISFADMMTLLFALFVVLYAMGVQDLEKLRQLKQSIQFAFAFEGDGKTDDIGTFHQVTGAGDAPLPAPLLNAQLGSMQEFLEETLVDFQQVVGKSLELDMTNDAIKAKAPLLDFFEPGQAFPLREEVMQWLGRAIEGSVEFASDLHVRIDAVETVIGRTATGAPVTSADLCWQRLCTLEAAIRANPQVRDGMVGVEFRRQKQSARSAADWEHAATVTLSFSNARADGR